METASSSIEQREARSTPASILLHTDIEGDPKNFGTIVVKADRGLFPRLTEGFAVHDFEV